jgi:hypothetical protein
VEHAQLLEIVRQTATSRLAELATAPPEECCESILIRDGCYYGRRFVCREWSAIWISDDPRITLHGPQGSSSTEPLSSVQPATRDHAA